MIHAGNTKQKGTSSLHHPHGQCGNMISSQKVTSVEKSLSPESVHTMSVLV